MQEYLKHLLIRTPFESTAKELQSFFNKQKLSKHPELKDLYAESQRMEKVMTQIIKDDFNCIDIGCHLGSVLSDILKLAPNQHHIAFEAIPKKATWLKQKFPEVDVKQMALGDTVGEVSFYIYPERSGFSGLKPRDSQKNAQVQKITVECQTLDNVLNPDIPVNFLKVDVEGAELPVFRGASKTLSRYQPAIIFECAKGSISNFGYTPEDLFNFLTKEHSYSIYLFKDFLNKSQPLTLQKFSQALQYPFQAFNFLASN